MASPGLQLAVKFLTFVIFCWAISTPTNGLLKQVQLCGKNQNMINHLQEAGITKANAKTYAAIFKRHYIDPLSLSSLTTVQLEKLGISVLGHRLKIGKYFSSDVNDCGGVKSPCLHGGKCKDGFKCYTCICSGDYYGPRCETKCPCNNNGKCQSVITGFKCKCPPGFGGTLCQSQWLTEDRFTVLEKMVKSLETKLNKTQTALASREEELREQRNLLEKVRAEHNGTGWALIRVNEIFNKLDTFNLHQQTPTYIQKMPICFPKNTKAILISIYLNFWNRGGHAYMDFITYQDGNEKLGKVKVINTHFQIYANTFYYELMLPWNTKLPNQIVFKITNSYNTGGGDNWYRVRLVGYITA